MTVNARRSCRAGGVRVQRRCARRRRRHPRERAPHGEYPFERPCWLCRPCVCEGATLVKCPIADDLGTPCTSEASGSRASRSAALYWRASLEHNIISTVSASAFEDAGRLRGSASRISTVGVAILRSLVLRDNRIRACDWVSSRRAARPLPRRERHANSRDGVPDGFPRLSMCGWAATRSTAERAGRAGGSVHRARCALHDPGSGTRTHYPTPWSRARRLRTAPPSGAPARLPRLQGRHRRAPARLLPADNAAALPGTVRRLRPPADVAEFDHSRATSAPGRDERGARAPQRPAHRVAAAGRRRRAAAAAAPERAPTPRDERARARRTPAASRRTPCAPAPSSFEYSAADRPRVERERARAERRRRAAARAARAAAASRPATQPKPPSSRTARTRSLARALARATAAAAAGGASEAAGRGTRPRAGRGLRARARARRGSARVSGRRLGTLSAAWRARTSSGAP